MVVDLATSLIPEEEVVVVVVVEEMINEENQKSPRSSRGKTLHDQ